MVMAFIRHAGKDSHCSVSYKLITANKRRSKEGVPPAPVNMASASLPSEVSAQQAFRNAAQAHTERPTEASHDLLHCIVISFHFPCEGGL